MKRFFWVLGWLFIIGLAIQYWPVTIALAVGIAVFLYLKHRPARPVPPTVEMEYRNIRMALPSAERQWFDQQAAQVGLLWIGSQNNYVRPESYR